MNIKCPNCGGTMFFDPESGQMKCTQCQGKLNDIHKKARQAEYEGSTYVDYSQLWYGLKKGQCWGNMKLQHGENYNEEWENSEIAAASEDGSLDGVYRGDTNKRMEVKLYTCTFCGAALMINGSETSTFCSFCGQPTVVFDRVSKEYQPDFIIPFKITAAQAERNIRERFGKGQFIPREIKNFTVEDLRGIYIPFWLFTSFIREKANIIQQVQRNASESYNGMITSMGNHYTNIVNKNEKEDRLMYRDVECVYNRVALDASRKLNDELAQRLVPYNMDELLEFDPKLMTGFYADRYDVMSREAAPLAYKLCCDYISEDMMETVMGSNRGNTRIVKAINQYYVENIEYAMLPAWFLTFRSKGQVYTVLVNGQTGKVVGNVPFDKTKAVFQAIVLSLVFGILIAAVVMPFEDPLNQSFLRIFGLILAGGLSMFLSGWRKLSNYINDRKRFTSLNIKTYVNERQDKTWIR